MRMHNVAMSAHPARHEIHTDPATLGLWTYIMSDAMLFASLFAAYAVLQSATAGGPTTHELFDRSFVLGETVVLLASSFTCGMAVIAAAKKRIGALWLALAATFALGATFIGLELHEFSELLSSGHSWQASAFLSSFFTLVGTHGLHVLAGLIWLAVIALHLMVSGLTSATIQRIGYFALFWHFLDIIWIFIFSFVYLFGTL